MSQLNDREIRLCHVAGVGTRGVWHRHDIRAFGGNRGVVDSTIPFNNVPSTEEMVMAEERV